MLLLSLASCRSTVPQPTMSLENTGKPLPKYSMHNIGPQRAFQSLSVAFADLDQDGHLDLLVGGRDKTKGFHVEWGDGQAHWRVQGGPDTVMFPRSFAVGDVDHDGAPEVLIGGEGGQKGLQVWKLDGNGEWRLHSTPVESGSYHEVKLADLNGDGWPDVVAARSDSEQEGGIRVLLNDGKGGWVPWIGPMTSGIFTGLAVADLNRDGAMDIVASRRGGTGAIVEGGEHWRQVGGVQVWYGDGTGRWELEVLWSDGDAESVTVADIDGDGRLDVAAGLYQQGIHAWLAKQSSGWREQQVVGKGTWNALRVGDLEGDGLRELVAASGDGRGLGVWGWKGGYMASRPGLLPNYDVYRSIDLGDIRNVGRIDVAAVRADGGVEVWSGETAAAQPPSSVRGEKVGERLSLYFESASAALSDKSLEALAAWAASLPAGLSQLQFEIEGHADVRAVHSDIYPNNAALSRARAESVAAWLTDNGAIAGTLEIDASGASDPLPPGLDSQALQQNRRVFIQAFRTESVRLPGSAGKGEHRDLFHVEENRSFKVIDGIPGYKVGPGDELSLTFWQGGKSQEYKVTVQINGTVSLPYQEALPVSGLTPREIDAHVTKILSRYERHPRVDVQVLKHRSKTITIFGEVMSLIRQPSGPGTYNVIGRESLVDFISRAGGPTKEADLTSVEMIRGGKTIVLDLERAIKQGDWTENAVIDDGDTIFIPSLAQSKRQVYVLGEVSKPGIVEFVGDINFIDAVSKSGNFTKDAYLPDIRVLRMDRDKPLILPVNFERLMEKGDLTQNLALRDKDILIVPSRPIANWNKFIGDIQPTVSLLLQPVSIYQQVLTIQALNRQIR